MDYDNFDIRINKVPGMDAYFMLMQSARRTALPGALPLAYSDADASLRDQIQFDKIGRLVKSSDVQALGAQLRARLFPGDAWNYFAESRQATSKIKGLRVRLHIDPEAAALSQLPWEYCFDDQKRQKFIGLSARTPIVRVIPTGFEYQDLETARPKLLVAVASPKSETLAQLYDLNIKERLRQAFRQLNGVVDYELVFNVTVDRLIAELGRGYDIFQFMGHGIAMPGRGGWLYFETEGQEQHRVAHDMLAQLLEDKVKLCILTACESSVHDPGDMFSGLAQALVRANIPAVVGMQIKIEQEAAANLTVSFYRALVEGLPVDEALISARLEAYLKEAEPSSWGIPVLYLQSEDGRIWPNKSARESTERAEALAERGQLALEEPEEARPKEVDNLLQALTTLGFSGQRNMFAAYRTMNRAAAITLAGSETADKDGLKWLASVLQGDLWRATGRSVRQTNLNSQALGGRPPLLWQEIAKSCGVPPGNPAEIARALVDQLDTHSLMLVVDYEQGVHIDTLLFSFWSTIQALAGQLPVSGEGNQTMILLLVLDAEDELGDSDYDMLQLLPPIRRFTEQTLITWHESSLGLLPATMQDTAIVQKILFGDDELELQPTAGLADLILDNMNTLCDGILSKLGS